MLYNDKFNRDIEERSLRKAQGEGAGEMAAGAILGGLVLGPFGTYSQDNPFPSLPRDNFLWKASFFWFANVFGCGLAQKFSFVSFLSQEFHHH